MAALLSFLTAVLAADDPKRFAMPNGPVGDARRVLREAPDIGNDPRRELGEQVESLRQAAEIVVPIVDPHAPAADALAALRISPRPPVTATDLQSMKQAAASVLADLSFQPVAEAELPADFPTYTPVGMIEVKKYPAYRLATGPGFWTLFMHIQMNGIAMTAPVEMTYADGKDGELEEAGMAFLYGDTNIGQTGRHGTVAVMDKESQTVVSLGVRGQRSPDVLADAARRFQRWISAHPCYQAAGPLRVMGYNSPYVARDQQYFEVQLPLTHLPAVPGPPPE